MPPSKSKQRIECQICLQFFKSSWGLTQHYKSQHPRISGDSSIPNTVSPDEIPVTIPTGVPPMISDISCSPSEENEEQVQIFPQPSMDSPISSGDDSDNYGRSDADADSTDTESDSSLVDIGEDRSLPDQIKHNESLPHTQAGYIYQIESSPTVFNIQKELHRQYKHPYYPWSNKDEFWLADFIFLKSNMSMKASDYLLEGFRCQRISMPGLSFSTSRHMLKTNDQAPFIHVFIKVSALGRFEMRHFKISITKSLYVYSFSHSLVQQLP